MSKSAFRLRAAALAATAILAVVAAPAAAHERDVLLGTAVDVEALAQDDRYRSLLARKFESVTAENVMKWYAVEPQRGVDDFAAADRLVRFARRHGQSVYGHTLIWHNQLPAWLTEGEFTKAELARIMRRHIFAVVGHFRGKVRAWDVVNEAIDDNGQWRDTIFYRAFGPEYVAMALRWARQADPHVKLFLNDYNIEGINAKSTVYYELAKELRRRHVPLDGIGIQGHLSLMYDFPGQVTENLRRFARLGLEPAFTEVDVRIPLPASEEELARQADWFGRLLDSCRAVRPCRTFTVWGFTDRYSWVPSVFPGEGAATPFDENYRPKPAWFAIRDALRD